MLLGSVIAQEVLQLIVINSVIKVIAQEVLLGNVIAQELIVIVIIMVIKGKTFRLCPTQILWPPQDPQTWHSSKAYSVKLWVCYLWCGQGACQNPETIGWQVPTPHYQHPRLCGTSQAY